jgi:hypothetical protein
VPFLYISYYEAAILDMSHYTKLQQKHWARWFDREDVA